MKNFFLIFTVYHDNEEHARILSSDWKPSYNKEINERYVHLYEQLKKTVTHKIQRMRHKCATKKTGDKECEVFDRKRKMIKLRYNYFKDSTKLDCKTETAEESFDRFIRNLFFPHTVADTSECNHTNFSLLHTRTLQSKQLDALTKKRIQNEKQRVNPFEMFYDLSKYRTEEKHGWLKNDICMQFLALGENVGRKTKLQAEVDLILIQKLLSKEINENNVKYLMIFKLEAVESALYKATFEEDTD